MQNTTVNSMGDIKKFLGTPERPMTSPEFVEFWKSLTEEEKTQFKLAKLY